MGNERELLPFKVGQTAEAKSFIPGFRSAWFRCKVKEIASKSVIRYALEYFDFPDEKIKWTKIYQKNPIHRSQSNELGRELMVRPSFPQVIHKTQMAHIDSTSEETVIVDDLWKVGDMVDWLIDGCYWSGTVTEVLNDERIKIQLPDPPIGEGLSYEVSIKDLRPSLEWSPEYGWTVPVSKEGENLRSCARLIQPLKHDGALNMTGPAAQLNIKDPQAISGSLERDGSLSSHVSAAPETSVYYSGDTMGKHSLSSPESKEHRQESDMDLDMEESGTRKISCSDSVSATSLLRNVADNNSMAGNAGKDGYFNGGSYNKNMSDEKIPLNIESSDTLEAAIFDLEELRCKVRWLKEMLNSGISLEATRPSWQFVESRAYPPNLNETKKGSRLP